MTAIAGSTRQALSLRLMIILVLLALSASINYIDRTTLSVAATNIQKELTLTNTEVGSLQAAFFATYAFCQISFFAGWLAGRFHVGWVLAGGFFLWSGATALTGAAVGFSIILILRLLLGIGESVSYPCYSRILASEYPEHQRGFANALIDAGTKAGPALGLIVGGLLVADVGWRTFFFALGGGCLLWLIPWFIWMPRSGAMAAREQSAGVPSIDEVLRQRSAWFSAFGLFCGNYYWYFLITWLPAYLEKERHFPKEKMALVAWAPFLCIALSCLFSGWLSDRFIASGHSPTKVRKAFAGVGLTLATLIIPVAIVEDVTIAMALLMLACLCFGIYTSNLFAITQSIAGPRAAGKWTSFQNGFGNFAGVLAPWLTGWSVDRTGTFFVAFLVAACFALVGAGMFVFGVGPVKEMSWPTRVEGTQPPPGLPFSLGAAGCSFWWLCFHGKGRWSLWALLIGLSPLIVRGLNVQIPVNWMAIGVAWLVATVGLGIYGSRIAWRDRAYQSIAELRAGERRWSLIGGVGLAIQVAVVASAVASR